MGQGEGTESQPHRVDGDEVMLLGPECGMLVQNGRERQGRIRLAPKVPALNHRDATQGC